MKDAFPCDLHHAAGKGDTREYAQAGDDHDNSARRHPGAYGRVQEVDRIIADTNHQVQDGKTAQYDYSQ